MGSSQKRVDPNACDGKEHPRHPGGSVQAIYSKSVLSCRPLSNSSLLPQPSLVRGFYPQDLSRPLLRSPAKSDLFEFGTRAEVAGPAGEPQRGAWRSKGRFRVSVVQS